jgi:hypothetical protein
LVPVVACWRKSPIALPQSARQDAAPLLDH